MLFLEEEIISVKIVTREEAEVRAETTYSRRTLDHRQQPNQETCSVEEKVISKGIVPRERKETNSKQPMLLRTRNFLIASVHDTRDQ